MLRHWQSDNRPIANEATLKNVGVCASGEIEPMISSQHIHAHALCAIL